MCRHSCMDLTHNHQCSPHIAHLKKELLEKKKEKKTRYVEVHSHNHAGLILHGGNKGGCLNAPGHCLGALKMLQ